MFYIKIVVFVEAAWSHLLLFKNELKITWKRFVFYVYWPLGKLMMMYILSESEGLFMSRHLEKNLMLGQNIFSRKMRKIVGFCYKNITFMNHFFLAKRALLCISRHLISYFQTRFSPVANIFLRYIFLFFAKIMTKIALSSSMKQHFFSQIKKQHV